MEIFDTNTIVNILPQDGIVNYYGEIFGTLENQHYFERLLNNIAWKHDEVIIYGKHIVTKRKAAWYGSSDYKYTYSNITKSALNWTKELLELNTVVEKTCGVSFNSCLLNLYHNGEEGMAWHSDDERSLGKDITIASLSFGAERKFCFKHKITKTTVPIMLGNGSLLVMKGATQTNWLHSLPKTKKVVSPRINLTFRNIVEEQ